DLYSTTGIFGGYWSTLTGTDGRYTLTDAPVGTFNIAAYLGADRADTTGSIAAHGDLGTLNLQLLSSAIGLPPTLYDANQPPRPAPEPLRRPPAAPGDRGRRRTHLRQQRRDLQQRHRARRTAPGHRPRRRRDDLHRIGPAGGHRGGRA